MASKAEKDIAKDDQFISRELYKALLKDDLEKVIGLCERIDEHALHVLTMHKDTVLHKATYAKQTILVLRLLEALPPLHLDKMTRKNDVGNTILHEAATLNTENSVEVATKMLEKAPELLSMANNLGETALFRAARYGNTEIFNFLADKIKELDEVVKQEFIQRDDKTTILHSAILSHHFG
jgi:ankyrin repeat protein